MLNMLKWLNSIATETVIAVVIEDVATIQCVIEEEEMKKEGKIDKKLETNMQTIYRLYIYRVYVNI